MKLIYLLASLPFLGILGGIFFANRDALWSRHPGSSYVSRHYGVV